MLIAASSLSLWMTHRPISAIRWHVGADLVLRRDSGTEIGVAPARIAASAIASLPHIRIRSADISFLLCPFIEVVLHLPTKSGSPPTDVPPHPGDGNAHSIVPNNPLFVGVVERSPHVALQ